jgi:hypothetical protein
MTNAQFSFDTLSSNLPLVIIDTDGKSIRDEPKITARMGITDNQDNINKFGDPFNDYDGFIGIEIRGNSTQEYPKKSYGFETRLEDGSNNNVKLLGLPRENDWVFYGPYADKSLIRNALIFQLSNEIGRYAPRTKFCELVINNNYRGVYVLMEKIKRDDDRVDIAKLDENDVTGDSLTGGYLLKCDWAEGSYSGWRSTYSVSSGYYSDAAIIWVDPDYSELQSEQKDYIENFVTEFETVLKGKDFRDPEFGYYNFIDIDSFIDFMLFQELANNVDAYALSTFLYKKRDSNGGKLVAGPLWDFNHSLGNVDYGKSNSTTTYSFNTYLDPSPRWWLRFLEDSTFTRRMNERWKNLRLGSLSDERIYSIIDSLTLLLSESSNRNFQQWDILGRYIWPNYFIGDTYIEEIEYLKDWIGRRFSFLDKDIPKLGERYNLQENEEEENENEMNPFSNSLQISPNPSNSIVNFYISQSADGPLKLTVYNILGEKITELYKSFSGNGEHIINWDGEDLNNKKVAPGMYLVEMKLNYEVVRINKFVMVK